MPGFWITLEGIEGAGKSTIAQRLSSWLQERGWETFNTREPGGTAVGEALRDIILNSNRYTIPVETELLLIEAARAQIMDELVLPKLRQGAAVVLDRHCDSTIAYQGYGRGIDIDWIDRLNRFATRGHTPHCTILLDVAVETGLSRARSHKPADHFQDRFESETIEFLTKVKKGFLEIASRNPDRIIVVPADRSLDEVWREIQDRFPTR